MKEKNELQQLNEDLLTEQIVQLIESSKNKVALFLNKEVTILYWSVGNYILNHFKSKNEIVYGKQILATLSQHLTEKFGKGFSYSAITRMIKVAENFNEEKIVTLSQQLSWSHCIELASVENKIQQKFYLEMAIHHKWNLRLLRQQIDAMLFERTILASKPEEVIVDTLQNIENNKSVSTDLVFKNTYILDFLQLPYNYSEKELENALINNIEAFILELGSGFAFIERQKRISVDAVDYHLDLLFYHRKLNRLIAIDLKLGKFKPEYKSQMELYLRWLEKNEKQSNEDKPIGLILCSEGNTEHIELLMLDEKDIKVAQYLTELPSKEWFADKLHRAIEIAKSQKN
ncbi:MAG: PDDEXK nuclease domain-containing protein [Limnohabitans sp.]|nr:PDDEXK nuclease domain-containing protein [Limnohabitans sp.]